ncbi:DUF6266 family protein [Pedobacter psychroterrae]|uniref:Uncharacterized protein n=1 Tax=Pedobacter psychroterrae TaxID=2530453 RepID=A0A4R0NIQ3_9SPHI|nr:DUF6266 family protein [Pedobacter psychroterrae]TCD00532.1 hypothetical protein EZ437_15040 [Pedobacter psychroterrae]
MISLRLPLTRLTVLVYNPVKDDFVRARNIAARSLETYTMHLPAEYSGDIVHIYVAFNSATDQLLVSKSRYQLGFKCNI